MSERLNRTLRRVPSADLTLTPSSSAASAFNDDGVIISLSYNGADRIATLSGQKPQYGSWQVEARRIVYTEDTGQSHAYGGGGTATMTVTLPATSEYPADTATFTFTNANLSLFTNF